MSSEFAIRISKPGPRPAYYKVARVLWGDGFDIDSDGDSSTPEDDRWTELTVAPRGKDGRRLDGLGVRVDPSEDDPRDLVVRSLDPALCRKAAEFIAGFSGGSLIDQAGDQSRPEPAPQTGLE